MRTSTAVAGVLALSILVAGCSGPSGDSSTVDLTFRQFDPANEVQGLQEAVDRWNAENPDIQVEMQTLSPSNIQQFAREANSGSGPDIQQLGFVDVAFVADPGILTPLDDLMQESPIEGGTEDLLATDMVELDDQTWALPWTADTFALVYRPDVLEEAGIDGPPTTWEELASDAEQISSSSGGDTAGFCFAGAGSATGAQWFAINYYIWSQGGSLVEEGPDGSWQPGLSEDDLTSAIDYFADLFASGATPESYLTVADYSDPSIVNALSSGSCAMSYEPPQTFRLVHDQSQGSVTTAPMPDGLTDGSTHLGGRALGINANTDHAEEAWEVVKFLAGETTFETYDQYPASTSTLQALDVPDAQQGFVEQLPHSRSFARYIGAPMTVASIQQLVNQQFSAVYSGQVSSEQAARAVLDGLASGLEG